MQIHKLWEEKYLKDHADTEAGIGAQVKVTAKEVRALKSGDHLEKLIAAKASMVAYSLNAAITDEMLLGNLKEEENGK